MIFDIKTLKRIGYNMLRKHVKVEPALYYAAADELGILIMQDMPCLVASRLPNKAQHAEFQRQLGILVTQLRSYTSIFAWVGVPKSTHHSSVSGALWFSRTTLAPECRKQGESSPHHAFPNRIEG